MYREVILSPSYVITRLLFTPFRGPTGGNGGQMRGGGGVEEGGEN